MDDQALARLDRLLTQTPPEWSEDELLERMHIASELEVAGTPVSISNSVLAAYFRMHPDVAEEYAMLVSLAQLEQRGALILPAQPPPLTHPQPAGNLGMPAIRPMPQALVHFSSARAKDVQSESTLEERAIVEHEQAVLNLPLQMRVGLHVRGEVGTIHITLAVQPGTSFPIAGGIVRLYRTQSDDPLAFSTTPAIETAVLDEQGQALFTELESHVVYHIVVDLPSGQQFPAQIDADLWPVE